MGTSDAILSELVESGKPIGVGIIGLSAAAGSWAQSAHLPALRAVDGYDLRAVSAGSHESAVRSAEMHGVPRAFGSAAELAAGVLWQAEEPAGAARALGTATHLRGRRDHGNPRVRSLVRELAGKMGEEGFARAYAEGASGAAPLPK